MLTFGFFPSFHFANADHRPYWTATPGNDGVSTGNALAGKIIGVVIAACILLPLSFFYCACTRKTSSQSNEEGDDDDDRTIKSLDMSLNDDTSTTEEEAGVIKLIKISM